MAIVTNGRLEYEMSAIDITYPDVGKVTYRGSYPLIVPNQWTPPVKMPVKGDLIMLDGKQYRVLKINDTVAEVLAMYDASTIRFDDVSSGFKNIYAGRNIDTYCNDTFYNDLSASMKSAIINKTFTQDSWSSSDSVPASSHYTGKYNSKTYYLTLVNAAFDTSIIRRCYCISVQDVLDYLETTTSMTISDTTLTDENIWMLFWNVTKLKENKHIWLRSANTTNSYFVFDANAYFGSISDSGVGATNDVRPAFQIDLSKVDWVKV